MSRIILISGKAESGKDTVSLMMAQRASSEGLYLRYHFATAVKDVAKHVFGWNGKKDEKGRTLLQLIGDGGRGYDPDIWVDYFLGSLEKLDFEKNNIYLLVPDTRYQNEITKVVAWGMENNVDVITVRVERPNHESALTEAQRKNGSEIDLDDWGLWDFKIINDGTLDDLQEAVNNVMEIMKIDYKSEH